MQGTNINIASTTSAALVLIEGSPPLVLTSGSIIIDNTNSSYGIYTGVSSSYYDTQQTLVHSPTMQLVNEATGTGLAVYNSLSQDVEPFLFVTSRTNKQFEIYWNMYPYNQSAFTAAGTGTVDYYGTAGSTVITWSSGSPETLDVAKCVPWQTTAWGNLQPLFTGTGAPTFSSRVSFDSGTTWSSYIQAESPLGCGGISSYTKLLMHCDNYTPPGKTFIDSSGNSKTINQFGDAYQSQTQYYFGAASAYFDGNGDYLTVNTVADADFDFGAGDFSIDFWMRPDTIAGNCDVMASRQSSTYPGFVIYRNGATLKLYCSSNGSSFALVNGVTIGTLSATTWAHVMVTRWGGYIYCYLNGVYGSATSVGTTALAAHVTVFTIGGFATLYYAGYLDEIRIQKGISAVSGIRAVAYSNSVDANYTPKGNSYDAIQIQIGVPAGAVTMTSMQITNNTYDNLTYTLPANYLVRSGRKIKSVGTNRWVEY